MPGIIILTGGLGNRVLAETDGTAGVATREYVPGAYGTDHAGRAAAGTI